MNPAAAGDDDGPGRDRIVDTSVDRRFGPIGFERGLDGAEECSGLGAIVGAMVDRETMFMTGRIAMTHLRASHDLPARLVIASIVRIATSGTLMIGIVRFDPNQPVLSIVNVLPP